MDVAVEDTRGDEQGFLLILLLLVEIKYLLDTVGAIVCCDLVVLILPLIEGARDLLGDRLLRGALLLGHVL